MLDDYLRKQANQDITRKFSACFIMNDPGTGFIKDYYTLVNNRIPLNTVSSDFGKKLPKSYSSIPTTLLGRLAVDRNFQGQGIDKYLLINALKGRFDIYDSVGSTAETGDLLDMDGKSSTKSMDLLNCRIAEKCFYL
ncbi:MAG: hypothetical protein P8X42_17595 [Calditrichaceae bacterium]